MKKYISIIILLAVLVSGCSNHEEIENQSTSSDDRVFTASFHSPESRTYIEEGELLRWTEGDQISLFDGNTLNRQYIFDGKTGDNAGTFSIVEKPYGTGNDLSTANYAVYPYDSEISITESGVITATLPAEQNYAINSFGLGDNTMVAATQDKNDTFLKFKNVGGYLQLHLYGDDVTVKTITLTGNNNEKLAGKATITSSYANNPIVSMANDATNTITLDCGEGIKLGTTAETATTFWLVLPETTFESGFTITVTDINDAEFVKSTSKNIFIERNYIMSMTAFEVETQSEDIPYLTFSADATQTLTMSKAVATLEYSVNDGVWKELGVNTVEFGGDLGDLRIRGESSTGTGTNFGDYSKVIFDNNTPVACSGDIRTLVNYKDPENTITNNTRFCNLFLDCSVLTSAPELPAMALADYCYGGMFTNCTNLTSAPELPATTLTDLCYYSMFQGCTSLTTAPKLPATTLTENCYTHMFNGCTSLAIGPKLPATSLAKGCYYDMFRNCAKLTTAPELPATTLTESCYAGMFNSCINLTTTPKLPATTLAYACYNGMFANCTSLTTPEDLPATSLAEYCYALMFRGCKSLTITPELPATTLAIYCYDNMFEGCTSLTKAPDLPATTLAYRCYTGMFSNCTSLKEAPTLPAKTAEEQCYNSMFSGCKNLTVAPELPATTLAKYCYNYMFGGCTSLTSAPELPATELGYACYMEMFIGCTSLTTAPKLPATTLVDACYNGMFRQCTSLTTAPQLLATELAAGCYNYMFYGCNSLNNITMLGTKTYFGGSICLYEWLSGVKTAGTFTKSKEMTSLPTGSSGIPKGWTVKNYGEE